MRGSCNKLVGYQDSATLVLGEETEPGRLPDQHLPGPLAEGSTLAAHDTTRLREGTDATH